MTFEEFLELDNNEKKMFYLSIDWHNFVISILDESEMFDGYPKADGLRRISELLLGDILESKPTEIFPVNGNSLGRATVAYSIKFKWWDNSERTYSDVADVFNDGQYGNINDEFISFALATASTRAEGRALRKALKLKICTAEEISDKVKTANKPKQTSNNEIKVDSVISEKQIMFLNKICKQLNVNVLNLINSNGRRYERIDTITKKEASKYIDLLQCMNRGEKQVSPELIGYEENWRQR